MSKSGDAPLSDLEVLELLAALVRTPSEELVEAARANPELFDHVVDTLTDVRDGAQNLLALLYVRRGRYLRSEGSTSQGA